MTSEDFIEDLRRNGVKLIKNDGSLVEIPSDFLKRATELCSQCPLPGKIDTKKHTKVE